MKLSIRSSTAVLTLLPQLASTQNVTVPSTCTAGYFAGTDTVIFTIPYTYAQTLSIIGSYQNLTWSGNPVDTVTLNGSDNTVGTARSYTAAGASVVETLLIYDKPTAGPYYEVHNLALLTVPSFGNVSFYAQYDGTTVTSVCGGKASTFNFTANFCATNASEAAAVLHYVHTADAMGAAALLGGANFTTCEALGGSGSPNATATTSGGAPVATYSSDVAAVERRTVTALLMAGVAGLLALL